MGWSESRLDYVSSPSPTLRPKLDFCMNEIAVVNNIPDVKSTEMKVMQWQLSLREKWLVELRLTGMSYEEIAREYKNKWGKKVSYVTMMRWMRREHVRDCLIKEIGKRAKVEGFDERMWRLVGIEVVEGSREMSSEQVAAWRELGRAGGYYKDGNGGGMSQSVQINFLQADGKK